MRSAVGLTPPINGPATLATVRQIKNSEDLKNQPGNAVHGSDEPSEHRPFLKRGRVGDDYERTRENACTPDTSNRAADDESSGCGGDSTNQAA